MAVTCMLLDKLIGIPGRNATAALCMDILGIFAGWYVLLLAVVYIVWPYVLFGSRLVFSIINNCLAAVYSHAIVLVTICEMRSCLSGVLCRIHYVQSLVRACFSLKLLKG